MLSSDRIRRNPDEVAEKLRRRGHDGDLGPILELFAERAAIQTEVSAVRQRLKTQNREVGDLYRAGKPEEAERLRASLAAAPDGAAQREARLKEVEERLRPLLLELPNLPDDRVPVGPDETANREIRRVGEPPAFDFEPRSHEELATALGIADLKRAAKLSGARFAVLRGVGAKLERALTRFMLDVQTGRGYEEIWSPLLVKASALTGTGQLPKFRDDLFGIEGRDLFLIPTAEVPLTNLHAEETLEAKDLPKRYVAATPCFRSEAGAYGQDTRGLIRQHQFDKVELVRVADRESSAEQLEALTADAERILQLLELPYRVVLLSTGDMGATATMTYDLEVWLPSVGQYREISSCSDCGDYQARRAGIRYRPAPGAKAQFCHTLNGSGLAVGRTWLALLENFQRADGSIGIPKALRPYLDGLEEIR